MPEVSQVHIDVALTNVSVEYRNAAFVAEEIAPPVSVKKQSGKYYVYDPEREAFRQTDDKRAPGTEANEVGFALSTDNYDAQDHALEAAIPDEERDNADPIIQPDIDHTEFLMEKIGLNQEMQLASLVLTNATLPGETLQGKVRLHAKIIDRMKYTQLRGAGAIQLAELFDVERVLVPRAVKNTANPGQPADIAYVWGKNAFLCYTPARPAMKQTAFAYTFRWALAPGSVNGLVVERWRENRRKADMIRVQKYYDAKVIAAGAIYVWKAAVA
ncbi:MAG: hypothetical protein NTW86_31845 [Candidatus Sumerlaeota bacterium]|nr:hypothetical protein [Candidatus Sumerlaeota bacterium]